jgi:hypothetical protein
MALYAVYTSPSYSLLLTSPFLIHLLCAAVDLQLSGLYKPRFDSGFVWAWVSQYLSFESPYPLNVKKISKVAVIMSDTPAQISSLPSSDLKTFSSLAVSTM